MSDPKPRKVSTDPGLGQAAHTDPGAPTELLDDALEGFAGKLPPVAVRAAESDGREAAKYQSPPRVPPAPNTLPPAAPVIVSKPADIDTDLRAGRIVDHKPAPPVTTDPATPKAKRSALPIVLLGSVMLLIAAVAVIAWPKNEATVPSLASGSVPTSVATPSSSSQANMPSHSATTPTTALSPTTSAKPPATHAPSAQRPGLGLAPAPSSTPSADPIPPEFDLLKPK